MHAVHIMNRRCDENGRVHKRGTEGELTGAVEGIGSQEGQRAEAGGRQARAHGCRWVWDTLQFMSRTCTMCGFDRVPVTTSSSAPRFACGKTRRTKHPNTCQHKVFHKAQHTAEHRADAMRFTQTARQI